MKTITEKTLNTPQICHASVAAVKDALYVLNGKWKLPLIVTLENGPKRFGDIQRSLDGITPKILSKELKELELNHFVERKVFHTTPFTVVYELLPYSQSLNKVIDELRNWGLQHKQRIILGMKNASKAKKTVEP